jgi:hypothetical protein
VKSVPRELKFPLCAEIQPALNSRRWDNAAAESFVSSLKKERIKKQICKHRDLAQADVAD